MPKDTPFERCRVGGSFEVRARLAEDGTFTGYGSVFDNRHETSAPALPYGWDDVMAPGAFTKTLADHKTRGTLPAMLCQHDMFSLPIGAYTEVRQDEKGLYVEGRLALKVSRASDVHELMKIGAMRGLSIGFKTKRFTLDEVAKLRTIHEVELWEISPVTIPADPLALVGDVKNAGRFPSIREFEAFLRDVGGCSRKEAKAIAAEGWKAVSQRDADEDISAAIEAIADDWKASTEKDAEEKQNEMKGLLGSIENTESEWKEISRHEAESALADLAESIESIPTK
jgi:HK97 family phage prohead protease